MVVQAETIRRTTEESTPASDDAFARMLAYDERSVLRFRVSFVLTVALYAALGIRGLAMSTGVGGFADSVLRILTQKHHTEYEIEPPPPPPPEPPAPEPEPEVPKEAPPPRAVAMATPPPVAEAGKVLTADPDEPVDLTGDGFVQGTGDTFAGGVTSSTGTSHTAVRDVQAIPTAEPGPAARAAAPAAPGRDMSRKAMPLGGSSWDQCGFPAEADIEQINSARVSVVVTTDAEGHATGVTVTRDPGFGFGALAKRCALGKRYSPALNKAGEPVAGTQTINISFRR